MDEANRELANRLCSAVGSFYAGVGYDHYRRTYFNEETMGAYWFALAETVLRDVRPNVFGTSAGDVRGPSGDGKGP